MDTRDQRTTLLEQVNRLERH